MTTTAPAPITAADLESLVSGRPVKITHGSASLVARWVSLPGSSGLGTGAMPKELRFVMAGPSGIHSLMVSATDLARLNAHWQVFAADPRNS